MWFPVDLPDLPAPTLPQANMEAPRTPLEDLVPFTRPSGSFRASLRECNMKIQEAHEDPAVLELSVPAILLQLCKAQRTPVAAVLSRGQNRNHPKETNVRAGRCTGAGQTGGCGKLLATCHSLGNPITLLVAHDLGAAPELNKLQAKARTRATISSSRPPNQWIFQDTWPGGLSTNQPHINMWHLMLLTFQHHTTQGTKWSTRRRLSTEKDKHLVDDPPLPPLPPRQ